VQEDSNEIKLLLEKNPDYKELAAKAMDLWNEIIEKDIENQEKER